MLVSSLQSRDYYDGNPYPRHAFSSAQWPAAKGPIPTALPYTETLIRESAEFVFRNGAPQFSVADDDAADDLLQEIIEANSFEWVALAENAGNQGAIAAKFSIDLDSPCPVRIAFLNIPQECRVWVDPHDVRRPLMARIQYPYRDLVDGRWYYFREEWTDTLHVTYFPKYAGGEEVSDPLFLPGYTANLGDGKGWVEEAREANEVGLIPVTVIRNRALSGNPMGEGDCWRLFRLMDRIALTMHGEDRSNQLHSEPIQVAINARIDNDGPVLAGEPLEIRNDGDKPADFKLIEPSGAAREFSHRSIDKWEELLYAGAGLSRLDPHAVSNKGNMTALALTMIYSRTIATSDRKRKLWGEDGMCVLFRNILLALKRVGGVKEVAGVTEDTRVSCTWPTYFEETPQDLETTTDRTAKQVDAGFLTPELGAERVAKAEKMPPKEIEKLLMELKGRHAVMAEAALLKSVPGLPISRDPAELANTLSAAGVNSFSA
jgi:hypothetical protein